MDLVIAITGATGAMYGITLLEELTKRGIRTHLIISRWARRTIELETDYAPEQVAEMAAKCYDEEDLAAAVSSGSFRHQGMVILPCSMKTLSGIAHGYGDNLIQRAADVTIKENRRLILAPRETPLNAIHLENMLKLARLGVVIMPPMPAFYNKPSTLEDLRRHFIGRVLDHLDVENDYPRWTGS
ncbi:MAG: UbiX family flavin prenyltransferase [Bacillota bacterium]